MMTILDFEKMKCEKRKISMVTCYDAWTARIADGSSVDCLLVGDSVAMVVHGFESTLGATTEMMALHTAAVARMAKKKFIVGDMPFPSFRKGIVAAMESVDALMKAGAHAVKLEGVYGHEDVVRHIVGSGVPVMGHIGLTPQSIHQLGGFRVQGREDTTARSLMEQAKILQDLGCFALVLECVPSELSQKITESLTIPTIGIGAGPFTDGQVLVLQDLLGTHPEFKPKFLRTFMNGYQEIKNALDVYDQNVKSGAFPTEKESYQ